MKQDSTNLDLLRATAITLVLFSHVLEVLGLNNSRGLSLWGIDNLGKLGVSMFFIHTSLVLMMSLARLASSGPNMTTRFYIRRFFRIYPLSILTVILVLGLKIPAYFEPNFVWPGWRDVTANLLLVQNIAGLPSVNGPLWSLPFEVQMYVLLPFIWLATRRNRFRPGALSLIACGFLLFWCESHLARIMNYQPLFTYAPWFFLGVAAYSFSLSSPRTLNAKFYPACLFLFVVATLMAHRLIQNYRTGWVLWALGIGFSIALPRFEDITSPATRRIAHTVAKYSYGLYLAHVPILWLCFRELKDHTIWLQWAGCVTLLAAVPLTLYHLVESPMIKLGSRVADAFSVRRQAAAVVAA